VLFDEGGEKVEDMVELGLLDFRGHWRGCRESNPQTCRSKPRAPLAGWSDTIFSQNLKCSADCHPRNHGAKKSFRSQTAFLYTFTTSRH